MTKTKALTVTMPYELYQDMADLAQDQLNCTVHEAIRMAIIDFVNKHQGE